MGAFVEGKLRNARVIGFQAQVPGRGIPVDYRASPVGVWHNHFPSLWRVLPTKTSRSYLMLAYFQAPEAEGQASHFLLNSFYLDMIGFR